MRRLIRWLFGCAAGLFGCATMIAAVAFVFGLVGALFATTTTVREKFLIAAGVAAMAFVAALILGARDYSRHRAAVAAVCRMLLTRDDLTEADFVSHFSEIDPILLGQIRQAIADFFRVPVAKIHPGDSLRGHLQCDALEPGFHTFIVYHIFAARKVTTERGQLISFHCGALNGFADLAKEIQRILDGLASGRANADEP